jgi:hypothetical protein
MQQSLCDEQQVHKNASLHNKRTSAVIVAIIYGCFRIMNFTKTGMQLALNMQHPRIYKRASAYIRDYAIKLNLSSGAYLFGV